MVETMNNIRNRQSDSNACCSKQKGVKNKQSHKYGILQSRYFFRAIPLLVSLFFVTLPKEFKTAAI